jgi:hypothetical protein
MVRVCRRCRGQKDDIRTPYRNSAELERTSRRLSSFDWLGAIKHRSVPPQMLCGWNPGHESSQWLGATALISPWRSSIAPHLPQSRWGSNWCSAVTP